jgi:hypothetical protein
MEGVPMTHAVQATLGELAGEIIRKLDLVLQSAEAAGMRRFVIFQAVDDITQALIDELLAQHLESYSWAHNDYIYALTVNEATQSGQLGLNVEIDTILYFV